MSAEPVEIESKNEWTVAEIAVDGSFAGGGRGVLSYEIPSALKERIEPGQIVWVPLRKQMSLGLCLAVRDDVTPFALKQVEALVEPAFVLTEAQLETVFWLARETVCSLFSAAEPFLPPGVRHRAVEYLRLTERGAGGELGGLTAQQRKLVELLRARGELSLDAAKTAMQSTLTSIVPKLEAAGFVVRTVRVVDAVPQPKRDRMLSLVESSAPATISHPKQRAVIDFLAHRVRLAGAGGDARVSMTEVLARTGSDRAAVVALTRKGVVVEEHVLATVSALTVDERPAPPLTEAQAAAWRTIERALERGDPTPLLVHGVTGSGKTELYLRAVAWCLRRGRSAIVLVPEIALASQVVRRFRSRFPDQVAVLHSALPERERYASWQAVADGELRVVVGPRSALFAPVTNLGLIVLDEEHEGAYKQESEPRYQAGRLAEQIAAREGCPVLLGSATPSVETKWRSDAGEYGLVELRERVGIRRDGDAAAGSLELPPVEIVDMRLELHRGSAGIISRPLYDLVARTLAAEEQVMLFLNRRGTATVVVCRSCGTSIGCPNCDIPLVFHQDRGTMLCHRCNHRERPRERCPNCTGPLNYFGAGTQRVEAEVNALFPEARVARWDQDSVRRRGSHEQLLRAVERREVDIVVGTQMIAKGLDLPMVTAIGVIHADTMLNLPDFRAGERTFQLLTQVAGRAGRRTSGSRVIIQSYSPGHYAIQAASRHDYDAFYLEEIGFRKVHRYPPFSRLARYVFRHEKEQVCSAESEEMARALARHIRSRGVEADIIGPTPAFASRIRGKYQWNLVLRAVPGDFDHMLDGLPLRPGWSVDVDPQSLL